MFMWVLRFELRSPDLCSKCPYPWAVSPALCAFFSKQTNLYVCVCVCVSCSHVSSYIHLHVCTRRPKINLGCHFLWQRVSYWPEDFQLGQSGWPGPSESFSTSLMLGLQSFTMPGLFFMGFRDKSQVLVFTRQSLFWPNYLFSQNWWF